MLGDAVSRCRDAAIHYGMPTLGLFLLYIMQHRGDHVQNDRPGVALLLCSIFELLISFVCIVLI